MKSFKSWLFLFVFLLVVFGVGCPPEPPTPEYIYKNVCMDSGKLQNTYCPDDRIEFGKRFVKGTEPTEYCDFHTETPPEYVWYYVCMDSGKLQHIYCPADRIEHRKYLKNSPDIPTEWCDFHTAPDPPAPDPKAPFIAASCYQLLAFTPDEITEFIGDLRDHKGNATEIFLNFVWPLSKSAPWKSYLTSGWQFSLYKIDSYWTEPEKFGDYPFPMYDLEKWNPETWDKLRVIFEECKHNGIALFMRIGDYTSLKRPFYKRHYPYNNGSNIQVYTGGNWGTAIQKYYKIFNAKLMELIEDVGLTHYFIIPQNEADVIGEWPGGEAEKDQVCIDFHNFYINDFRRLGVRKDQLIINTERPNVNDYFAGRGYLTEHHRINSPEMLKEAYETEGDYIFPNGDGPDPLARGIAGFNGNREPSKAQGVKIGQRIQEKFGYGYFLRSIESKNVNDISVTYVDFIALDGMIEGLNGPPLPPDPPEPPEPPAPDKKLTVENGKLYYGGEEIKLCGVSRREALWRETGEYNPMGGWTSDYTFTDYETDIKTSGINYVRHLGIKDTHFMMDHIRRMKAADVIVEIEVYDAYKGNYGVLVDIDSMGEVAEIGNVFFDVGNEFLDWEPAIDVAINLATRLKGQGCIVSAGAWSGDEGKEYSDEFHIRYSDYDIETHHREWTAASWTESLSYGRPVTFNEYFSQGNLTLEETKDLMDEAFDTGCLAVNYYGFRFDKIPGLTRYDPFDYRTILIYAGQKSGDAETVENSDIFLSVL